MPNEDKPLDLNRVMPMTEEQEMLVRDELNEQYTYHAWSEREIADGAKVRDALQSAAMTIIKYVPPCADRATALRKLREARMDANSAITHKGRY